MRLSWRKHQLQRRRVTHRMVTHWAGDQFTFQGVSVQRCLWCGAELEYKEWAKIPVPGVDGKTIEQVKDEMFNGAWSGLVCIDVNGMRFSVPVDPYSWPDDACMWEGWSEADKAKAVGRLAAQRSKVGAAATARDSVQQPVDQTDGRESERWKPGWTSGIFHRLPY